ncbi:hypothetical protein GCM10011348_40660 [Marinobacterium nitratireducens]|uniref:VacJ n=1 Tax=Marinobacterium nitratireducens TaxID=518897 RepID=A0A917ZQJ5_9GAMM|nr:hypothetical protein [Marinobacterium nitratireducens]GGO87447.1 hypothetical protein GCM10011348_40660 [Marinobacterium nitratireducens]
MKLLNRAGLALLPREPFADWVNGLPRGDSPHEQMTLEMHRAEGTLYLIDEVFSEADFEQAIARHWRQMFENELAAWDEFGDHWPQPLSQQRFVEWFELKPQLMAIDLSAEPLMRAPLLDED